MLGYCLMLGFNYAFFHPRSRLPIRDEIHNFNGKAKLNRVLTIGFGPFILETANMDELDEIEDPSSPPIPAIRRRSIGTSASLTFRSSIPDSPPVSGRQAPSIAESQKHSQIQGIEAFHELHNKMELHRLRHLNQTANGLEESALPLWTHALENIPLQRTHEHNVKASFEVLRLQAERAAQSLKAAEKLQEANEKLEAVKTQKTIEKHQRAVQAVQTFLQSCPAAIIDLQSAGIDFGAVTREVLQAAEDALEAIKEENFKIIADLRTLEEASNEKSSLIDDLTAQVNEKSIELEARQEQLVKKDRTIKTALSQRDEAKIKESRVRRTNESLTEVIAQKDTSLSRFKEAIEDLGRRLESEKKTRLQESDRSEDTLAKKKTHILSLENDVKELEQEIAEQIVSVTKLEAEVTTLRQIIAQREDSIVKHEKSSKDARDAYETTWQKLEDVEKLLQRTQAEHSFVKERYSTAQRQITETSAKYAKTLAEFKQLAADLHRAKSSILEKDNQISDLSLRHQDAQAVIVENESKLVVLRNQVESAARNETDSKLRYQQLQDQSNSTVQGLQSGLVEAKQQVEELTIAVAAHVKYARDRDTLVNDMKSGADSLKQELEQERKLKGSVVSENASLKRKFSDLQAQNAMFEQNLRAASADVTRLRNQRQERQQQATRVLSFVLMHTRALNQKLSVANGETESVRKRLRDSNHTLSEQAIELANHRFCDQDRRELDDIRDLLTSKEEQLSESESLVRSYVNWLSTANPQIDSEAFQRCIHNFKLQAPPPEFLASRRSRFIYIHGLAPLSVPSDLRTHASQMLTRWCSRPCDTQVADIYSLEQALSISTPGERSTALLLIHTGVVEEIRSWDDENRPSEDVSMFMLLALDMLCSWSNTTTANALNLSGSYDKVNVVLPTDHTIISALNALVQSSLRFDCSEGLATMLTLVHQPKLFGDGYCFIKFRDDLLIVTPQHEAIFVPVCQCQVQAYDEDDPTAHWADHTELRYRLVVHKTPLLGTFKSCFWTHAEIGASMPVFESAMLRGLNDLASAGASSPQ